MKDIKSYVIGFLLICFGFSQSLDGIAIADIDADYLEIIGNQGANLKKPYKVCIFYGQDIPFNLLKNQVIKNSNGQQITFNSMTQALDFMNDNGYNFVDSYSYTTGQTNVFYHFILQRQ